MKAIIKICYVILLGLLFQKFKYINSESEKLDCTDFQTMLVGNIFGLLAKKIVKSERQTKLLLATKENPNPMYIRNYSWSEIVDVGFHESKKTYVIVHGFQNDGYSDWVAKFREELLKKVDVNILIVNWGSYSYRWNYVDAVYATPQVRNDIFTALQEIKMSFKMKKNRNKVSWNRLYFIGHSLGAHLSGQIAHLLKNDDFFKVERITGLDPARFCFSHCDASLKLDKDDAEFVDIIHTQTGNIVIPESFGAIEPLGHVDFYVNGGAMQPQCESLFYSELQKMMCSHGIVTDYFLESIVNFEQENACHFIAYKWNRTFADALDILKKRRDHTEPCSKCVEMGFDASKDKGTGSYLVITGINAPHCRFTDSQSDNLLLRKSLARLNVKNTTDTDPYEKYYLPDGNNV